MSFTPLSSPRDLPQVDATGRVPAGERALVLGGGGSTGNAWLVGVLAGLFESGLDVTTADLTVGTSAGSTAAAQLAGATPDELLAAVLATAPRPAGQDAPRASTRPVTDHLARMRALIDSAQDADDLRRTICAAALDRAAASDGTWQAHWHSTVASRLTSPHWPDRAVLITAVDAETAEPVVFDRHSGVDLVDAVAASCSSGVPYRIGHHQYLDGGYRANAENVDLASGHARVLVLSPFGGRTFAPLEWGTHLAAQVDALRAGGSRVEVLSPDSSAEHLFGVSSMDPSLRPPAARAGHAQGRAVADQLAELWR